MKLGWKQRRKLIVAKTEEAMVYINTPCIDCNGEGTIPKHFKTEVCRRCKGVGKEKRTSGHARRVQEMDQFGREMARAFTKELKDIADE